MARRVCGFVFAAFAGMAALWSDRALAEPEALSADISAHQVSIKTDFSGASVTIFGAVEFSRQPETAAALYDVVIALHGPNEDIVVRRKEQRFGLWVNGGAVIFKDAPSFYAVLSTRALNAIADEEALARHELGFNRLPLAAADADGGGAEFRRAIIQSKRQDKLYIESPFSVKFTGRSLFRATVDLPTNVPTGDYQAKVFLFRDGVLLDTEQSHITISKAGLGQFIHAEATDRPWLYGAAAVILALATGLAASALLRRG
jgi:uncharacterized protein (TIGR02186 family)